MTNAFSVKLSLRLFCGENKCFGPGMAELLERIDRSGSLRTAAAEMKMAYSKAWTSIKNCEAALGHPLLERLVGGPTGGSSRLTAAGRALLERYRKLERSVEMEGFRLVQELFPPDGTVV